MAHDPEATPREGLPIISEMRLTLCQWAVTLAIVALIVVATPRLWKGIERFDTGVDYRIPYQLSNDYWLFDWRLQKIGDEKSIVVLGDSVVWGQYVKSDGTLSHFLDRQAGQPDRFVNAGVNGLYPLALEGLVRNYGTSLRGRKLIVVCNLLWLSSREADMQKKSNSSNHLSLVPQFSPRIPGYRADVNDRLGAVIGRNVAFLGWVDHVQDVYFQQKSIPQWTLENDPNRPQYYPKTHTNPLTQITLEIPSSQEDDAQRGEGSPAHKPWTAAREGKAPFEWVSLESSLQWAAFQRTVALLRERGNDVLVVVTPFNRHMIAAKSVAAYAAIHAGVEKWLSDTGVPYVAPRELPSDLYADASHPLTAGYELLAWSVYQAEAFQAWVQPKR
jgi:hypothetical protein